jgi:hypothetical protein
MKNQREKLPTSRLSPSKTKQNKTSRGIEVMYPQWKKEEQSWLAVRPTQDRVAAARRVVKGYERTARVYSVASPWYMA